MLRRSVARRTAASLAALTAKRDARAADVARLPEVQQAAKLLAALRAPDPAALRAGRTALPATRIALPAGEALPPNALRHVTDAALLTFFLHVESRVMSLLGEGFYTIGPCGEELLAPIGLLLRPTDPCALHYRHVAVNVARQLGLGTSLESIAADRARGYVVSAKDPVAGGAHCCIGGTPADYLVTSTLASQTPPAVGRAMGGILAHYTGVPSAFPPGFVSFVSLGDGSVNNAHFLAAVNLAEYAAFRKSKVPVVFCITDNGLCISLKQHGWIEQKFLNKFQMPVFRGAGNDAVSVLNTASEALAYARKERKPCCLYLNSITRRFGHAATDRQIAYRPQQEIDAAADDDVLRPFLGQMLDAGVFSSREELTAHAAGVWETVKRAFGDVWDEPKLTSRAALMQRVAAPLAPVPAAEEAPEIRRGVFGVTGPQRQVMRKHMTAVFAEVLAGHKNAVYIGEDVRHGGYYVVTDGLAQKFGARVQDFPPEEGAIVGAGMGYAQAGLLPIVEIPYAKYLDCGMDMFAEACFMHFLSDGKQPNGMIVRLQGFDRGVFGGNFHTHNTLHMPPGLDVVACSNGPQYARLIPTAAGWQRLARKMLTSVFSGHRGWS